MYHENKIIRNKEREIMREIKRKINATENIAARLTIVLFFLSTNIVGTMEVDETVPAFAWIIYGIAVAITTFCLYYKHVLEERLVYEKERRTRRRELKEQLEREIEEKDDEVTMAESNIYYLEDYRKRG